MSDFHLDPFPVTDMSADDETFKKPIAACAQAVADHDKEMGAKVRLRFCRNHIGANEEGQGALGRGRRRSLEPVRRVSPRRSSTGSHTLHSSLNPYLHVNSQDTMAVRSLKNEVLVRVECDCANCRPQASPRSRCAQLTSPSSMRVLRPSRFTTRLLASSKRRLSCTPMLAFLPCRGPVLCP